MTLYDFYTIIKISLGIFVIGLGITTIPFFWKTIKNLIVKKHDYYDIYGAAEIERVQPTIEDRVDNSKALFELIDITINNEIMFHLKENLKLGEMYNTLNLDKDVEKIATIVFSSLQVTIIDDKRNLVNTPDYFMRYINQQTIFKMLQLTGDYNRGLSEQVQEPNNLNTK